MSQVRAQTVVSFQADDTLSAFRIVGLSASMGANIVNVPTTSTVHYIGATIDSVDSGSAAQIAISGSCKVQANSSISAGDLVTAETSGMATTTTATGATTTTAFPAIFGIALQNGSTNSVIEIGIQINNRSRGACA